MTVSLPYVILLLPTFDRITIMTPQSQITARRNTLNIRIKPELQCLIDQAAQQIGKTRTDFVLDAAKKVAEETLLEQSLISVNAKTFDNILKFLDTPVEPGEALKKTMQSATPWKN